ncbi:MAG: HNH endonuclease [Cetobacterium sp.]|uniref:HNH endonuclease n=1 Tax=Cetobacterium sp. TaxID=2071632 RepID=UPI003EE78141
MERMLKKVVKEGSCHLWNGCLTPDGYPRVGRNGNPNLRGHRYFYEQIHGKIPEGLVVRHTCDNRLCLNPEHLILGTQLDNVQDRVERSRSNNHKTQEQIDLIGVLRRAGVSQLNTAKLVGCSQMYVSRIERGMYKRTQNAG